MPIATDPRLDAYIAKSADFAQPILRHLRKLVHAASPDISETLKWGMPTFMLGKSILCQMAAFKAHAVFGFWHIEMEQLLIKELGKTGEAMGVFGRLTTPADLPSDRELRRYLKQAVALVHSGKPARPRSATPEKPVPRVPADLTAALRKNAKASATWKAFTPVQRRDYLEWIAEAKQETTRARRLVTTLEWLSEGKRRNWKYENC